MRPLTPLQLLLLLAALHLAQPNIIDGRKDYTLGFKIIAQKGDYRSPTLKYYQVPSEQCAINLDRSHLPCKPAQNVRGLAVEVSVTDPVSMQLQASISDNLDAVTVYRLLEPGGSCNQPAVFTVLAGCGAL